MKMKLVFAGGAWTQLREFRGEEHGANYGTQWSSHVLDIPQQGQSPATKIRFRQLKPPPPPSSDKRMSLNQDEQAASDARDGEVDTSSASTNVSHAGIWALDNINMSIGSGAPALTLHTSPQDSSSINFAPIKLIVQFSKTVTGFDSRDVVVSNGKIISMTRLRGLPGSG